MSENDKKKKKPGDKKSGGSDEVWIAVVIVAAFVGFMLLSWGLWLAVGIIVGLFAAAIASRRRINGKVIAGLAAAALIVGGLLGATSGPDWVTGFHDTLTTKTAQEMKTERRQARRTAKESGADYVDPDRTRGFFDLSDFRYGDAFRERGAHLAVLALLVALLTFSIFYWLGELGRRKTRREELREQAKIDQAQEAEDDRLRRIIREENERARRDDEGLGSTI